MGPRRDHSKEEFADLVAVAAEALVRDGGPAALGMRPLSAAIGYAPNSIYNNVGGLPEVTLIVNRRTLARLRGCLSAASAAGRTARARVVAIAEAYLAFVDREPRLWDLLLGYARPEGTELPEGFADELAATSAVVGDVIASVVEDAGERARTVAALWAGLQGIASLHRSARLRIVTDDGAADLARFLVARLVPDDA